MQNALDSVVLKYQSETSQAFQRQQEAVEYLEGISFAQINKVIYPLQVLNEGHIYGLSVEAADNDWPAIKQALINHIEQALERV